jgi:hypothetical protein
MSDQQIFQLFGLGFLATGIGMWLNPKTIKKLLADIEHSTAIIYLSGIISLTLGFLLVTFHNSWDFNWSLIITLVGWSGLIKGLSILISPDFVLTLSERIVNKGSNLKIIAWTGIALGIISFYLGFFA